MKASEVAIIAFSLVVAAALQQALSARIAVFGARPDFFLVLLSVMGILTSPRASIGLGFIFGLAQGALPMANLAHYAISRCLTGYVIGRAQGLRLHPTPSVVFGTAALATLFAQVVWMFIAAPPNIPGFLGDTIRSAIYNGVLAIPLHALLKRVFRSPIN